MRGSFDAIVIGGGPAGSLAGLLLARQGWRIAIVERGPRNRNKTCGHCLSPRALPILREAGVLDAVKTMSVGEPRILRVHTGQSIVELAVDGAGEGLLVERSVFDRMLLDRAAECGAEVIQTVARASGPGVLTVARASGPSAAPDARAGRPCHRNPLILGADGLGSGVARAFGVAPANVGRKFGFSFDVEGTSGDRPGAIDMFVAPGGYLGVVEQRDGSRHVAGLIGSHGAGALPREPVAFCRAMAMRFDELRAIGLHRIARSDVRNFVAAGPMPWRPRKIAGAGFALLGDAAGYVEPFTGEGMCWALQSAAALAEVVSDARPGTWNEGLAARYAAFWQERIGRAQRRCAWIAWGLARPWAVAAVRRLASRATLQRVARRVVAA